MVESHFREDYLICEERYHRFQRRRTFIQRSLPKITGNPARVNIDETWFKKVEKALSVYDEEIDLLPNYLTETEVNYLRRLSHNVHELLDNPPEVPKGLESVWREEEPG